MATHETKPTFDGFDLLPLLPPEGPELDALIKAKIAEADTDPRPGVPMAEVFEGLRRRIAERAGRAS